MTDLPIPAHMRMKQTAHGSGRDGMAFYSYEDVDGLGVMLDARRKDGRSPFVETWHFRWLPDGEFPTYQALRAAVAELTDEQVATERAKWPKMIEPPQPSENPGGGKCWLHKDRPGTRSHGVDAPVRTIHASGGNYALAQPVLAPFVSDQSRPLNANSAPANSPLRTQCANVKGGHFNLIAAALLPLRGTGDSHLGASDSVAEALRIQNAALAQNKDVLELRRIEVEMTKATKWNGALPQAIYAGAPIPFLNLGK